MTSLLINWPALVSLRCHILCWSWRDSVRFGVPNTCIQSQQQTFITLNLIAFKMAGILLCHSPTDVERERESNYLLPLLLKKIACPVRC